MKKVAGVFGVSEDTRFEWGNSQDLPVEFMAGHDRFDPDELMEFRDAGRPSLAELVGSKTLEGNGNPLAGLTDHVDWNG
jgi:hypothetical protein